MLKKMFFFKEFILNFKMVGAIAPSSKFLSKEIIKEIDFKKIDVIVELGGGTGIFTKELIFSKSKKTILVVLEKNPNFYKKLKKSYKGYENVFIILGCASNLKNEINSIGINKVDCIVSGLPFRNFSTNETRLIFEEIKKILKGELILFQYTLKLKKFILNYLNISKIKRIYLNFPPAYVIKGTAKE